MMASPRKKAFLLLIATLFLAGGVFVFMFYFNVGNINIHATPPYAVKISGGKNQYCESNPCLIKLYPKEYVGEFQKEGYFPEMVKFKVKRFFAQDLNVNFQKMLEASKMEKFEFFNLSSIPNNLENITFFIPEELRSIEKKIPKDTNYIMFSPKGNYALFESSKKVDLYDLKAGKVINSINESVLDIFWSEDESGFFYFEAKNGEKAQKLLKYGISSKQYTEVNYFPSTIEKARIFVSPEKSLIALIDDTDDTKTLYLVDIQNKWKKRIALVNNIAALKWSPQSTKLMVFSREPRSRINKVGIFDLNTNKYRQTKIETGINTILWLNDNEIMFASNQKYAILNNIDSRNIIIDILQDDILKKSDSYAILKYSYTSQHYQYVFAFDNNLRTVQPEIFEYDRAADILYFKAKKLLYQISKIMSQESKI